MYWTGGFIKMARLIDILEIVVLNSIFIITTLIFTTYLILTIFSAFSLRRYQRKNSYVDYNSIVASPLTPTLSVIAPAFNESKTIVDNIRTMLSLYYNNYEVIVVNYGSNDDTLKKIIEAYELDKVNYYFDYRLPCKRIRGVYKSQNRSFKKLTVIDKVNGGKADTLNAGLNVSKNNLIVSIDADSIMEPDALLKLVKPFLESKDKQVIGVGGVIRIANSCEISGGRISKIHLPRKFLPRAQVMEYTRAFLLGRMAWSELDGLLLISGALGMFDREIVIRAGGYSTKTVGEDMELVVRIRRYMAENNIPYDVVYIPDPLCWTVVPEDVKSLAKQRSRWTRGTFETIVTHRKLFLNRKYRKLGLLGYPYWLVFEWLSPIIEFLGIIWFIVLVILGRLNWPFFLLLFGFVYFFAVSLSIWAVVFEEITFHKYVKRRDVLKLIAIAFAEPLFFHPLSMLMNVKGNIDKIIGRNIWGKMERKGFSESKEKKKEPERVSL
jgi:biofilm PGA synthesis N-glycosyltransferase PgaC